MKRVLQTLAFAPVLGLSRMPFSVLYLFSDIIAFILCYIIKYRKKLISDHLHAAFPHTPPAAIRALTRAYYTNMADQIVEGVKGLNLDQQTLMQRMRYLNPEVATPYLRQNRSVIFAFGHYANWEWHSIAPLAFQAPEVAMYTPISNPVVDQTMRRAREQFGVITAPIANTARVFNMYHNKGVFFVMIGDQSPSAQYIGSSHWLPFLGRDTAFLPGIARYAKRFNLPVIFLHTRRVKRGYYETTLELLTDTPGDLPDEAITALYASRLEAAIREQPEWWMWSHRRWKHQRTALPQA